MPTLLVLGGTGAIGQAFVAHALEAAPDVHVVAWVRPASAGKLGALVARFGARLLVRPVDVTQPDAGAWPARLDAVVNCMGSNYVDGDAAEFWRIDHRAPLDIARAAHARGCPTFVLLSALGAHPRSPFLFLRTKGVLAKDLAAVGFARLSVLTPPFVSDSTVPRPWYERLALRANLALAPALVGPLAALRPVTRAEVARQLVSACALGAGRPSS